MADKKLADVALWEKTSSKGGSYFKGIVTALENVTLKKGDKIPVVMFNNEPQNETQPVLKGSITEIQGK